ncbi:MAG: hypothetical protein HN352_02040 [Bacteroidetes bacterium]|jgi:hypothetical protein|nr:hypothetical protein [Bacteroidota bacterium]MBT3749292.1 hypothetical protein [Bacteroidota bacterium]MBT4398245.1 hypothetical protein [Bacteroidota bacterium]MBT4409030.1 hypothetical protein [Bacteroidota bacterium]MBT5427842.1 hypothetical protein [Bacteroidota bacterium]
MKESISAICLHCHQIIKKNSVMKKKIILLSSITLLSFFMVISVAAQEKTKADKKNVKAKTEMVKKDVSKKCSACPTLDKCTSAAAVKAKKEKAEKSKGKVEKPLTISDKKKKRIKKK